MGKKKNKSEVDLKSNPDICLTSGDFLLPNGDKYSGEYCAHRAGLIWRQGKGIYTSHEGHIYEGFWNDDKLSDNSEVVISYPNGSVFKGRLVKNRYSGPGSLTLSNGLNISCEFNGNKPIGEIILIDSINGILFRGSAKENQAILIPENIFYLNLSEQKGIGEEIISDDEKIINEEVKIIDEEVKIENEDDYWEKIIFAKSFYTKNDVKFGDLKFFKDYERFKRRKREIERKLKEDKELNCEDKVWLGKFYEFKDKIHLEKIENDIKREKNRKEVFDLNRKFLSRSFLKNPPEVKVFYPTISNKEEEKIKNQLNIIKKISNESLNYEKSLKTVQKKPSLEKNLQTDLKKPKKINLSLHELDKFAQTLERLPSEEEISMDLSKKPKKPVRLHFTPERKNKILLSRINLLLKEELFKDDDETRIVREIKTISMAAIEKNKLELSRNESGISDKVGSESKQGGLLLEKDRKEKIQISQKDLKDFKDKKDLKDKDLKVKKDLKDKKDVKDVNGEEILTEQQKRINKYIEQRVIEWENQDRKDFVPKEENKSPKLIKKPHLHSLGQHTNEINDIPNQIFVD